MTNRLLTNTALMGLFALVGGGCGGQAAKPEARSWSLVETTTGSPVGAYSKTTALEKGDQRRVLIREWVVYDLRRRFIDRRIGLGDDPQTPAIERAATRADPSLRFMYRGKRVLMWNPGASRDCGTPWVEMPERLITRVTGFRLRDLTSLEPDAILSQRRSEPKVVQNNDRATVYEVRVPGTSGLAAGPLLRSNPSLVDKLGRQTVAARVRITRNAGPMEMVVDSTHALEAVSGGSSGGRLTISWLLERRRPHIDATLPKHVARASCLS